MIPTLCGDDICRGRLESHTQLKGVRLYRRCLLGWLDRVFTAGAPEYDLAVSILHRKFGRPIAAQNDDRTVPRRHLAEAWNTMRGELIGKYGFAA